MKGRRAAAPLIRVVSVQGGRRRPAEPGAAGVWACRAAGALQGRIVLPELPANLARGEDGTVLFLTARTSVYRLPTLTRGTLLG